MNNKLKLTAGVFVGLVALVGCSESPPEPSQTPSPTATASPSPRPSQTPTASPTPSFSAPPVQPDLSNNGVTDSVGEHLNAGGPCNSDVFPAGPPTAQALKEIQVYCEANFPVEGNSDGTFTYDQAYEAWSSGQMSYYEAFCENYIPQTSGGIQQCYGIEQGYIDAVTGEPVETELPPGFPPADGGDPYCNSDPVTGETACYTPAL